MKRKIIFFAVLVSIPGCLPGEQPGKEKESSKIMMVCHRGANRLAPENTYVSAQKAIEAGAAYVEVDVRRSKDGIYYNFHDHLLERTTNGSGLFSETTSEVIDTLDAGSWFAHEFAGEKVPRVIEFLKWIKGKAKVYFDTKDVDLSGFIPEIYALGMEKDCFFWFSDWQQARQFRKLYPDLELKVNASTVGELDSLQTIYDPQIIECSADDLSDKFISACHGKGMKVMPYIPGNDWEAYRMALSHDIDMINLDNPDVFADMAKNNGVYKGYKLIAHRGGIVEGKYNEFDPASIQTAIDQGYHMLEVDVQDTRDGVLILNHDQNFTRYYHDPRLIDEMTWEEVKKLRAEKGNDHPLSFEELAQMCSGKVKLMIDVKEKNPTPAFYKNLGEIMEKYGFLKGTYFIDNHAREYFWGKAKFMVRIDEANIIREKFEKGEDVACHYFLFDAGARLNASLIKMCQMASITVVPSVNFGHYRYENPIRGAKRDIEFLKACGVTEFQIDSDFDEWLIAK
ncbi:MAG: glycerophosphodiester phosphodiesterase family protein [Mangrovibacterium sp.]